MERELALGRSDAAQALVSASRLRWAAAGLSLALAFLAAPIVSVPGAVAVSLLMAAYNVPAAFGPRLPERVRDRVLLGTLVCDFAACSAWSFLTANDAHVANYVMFALVAVEAAMLYRWRGVIAFSVATAAVFICVYLDRLWAYGFEFNVASLLTRTGIIVIIAGLLGSITELSARRLSAYEAAAADAHHAHGVLQALVHDAPVGIARLDGEGRILDANPAFLQLLGYAGDQLRGRRLADLAAAEDAGSALGPYLAPGRAVRRWRRASGEVAWIDLSITVAPGRSPEPELVAVAMDVTAQRHEHEAVRHHALHDALTGLPNRVLLEDRLLGAIRAASREGHRVAVAEVDLDQFKAVNDTHGHWAGDLVLVALAERLVESVRESDTVARFGGDELVVVMPRVEDAAAAMAAATKLLDRIGEPLEVAGSEYRLTASVGIALYPEDAQEAGELLARADGAMYTAKRSGGGVAAWAGVTNPPPLPVTPPHLPLWKARQGDTPVPG